MNFSLTVLWHQLAGALLLPPLNFLLLILLGLALLRRQPRLGRALLAVGMAAAYLLSIPQMALWLNRPLEAYPVIRPAELARVDAIVVLGGGKKPAPEYGDNQPGADTMTRLRYGAHLARLSGKPLLVTGGAPLGGEAEALSMTRMLAGDYGIKPRWLEARSNTTLENAQFSAALLKRDGVRHVALVSQGWHLRRAVPFFEQQGLRVTPAPTGFVRYDGPAALLWVPQGRALQECHSALREWLGILFYKLR